MKVGDFYFTDEDATHFCEKGTMRPDQEVPSSLRT